MNSWGWGSAVCQNQDSEDFGDLQDWEDAVIVLWILDQVWHDGVGHHASALWIPSFAGMTARVCWNGCASLLGMKGRVGGFCKN